MKHETTTCLPDDCAGRQQRCHQPFAHDIFLAACGGSADDLSDAHGRSCPLAAVEVTAPLLDDNGYVFPSHRHAMPADVRARTRAGRYSTPAQAAQLASAMGWKVIPITVEPGPNAAAAVELSTLRVFGLQAARNLQPDAPVLVQGPELRLAAMVANQLEEDGFTRVFLVNH